jgi:hypothetical protein
MENEPLHHPSSEQTEPEKKLPGSDRRGRLKAAGVVQLVIGGFCTLFFLFALLGLLVGRSLSAQLESGGAAPNFAAILASVSMYAMGAVFFFVVGIGALKIRRWTRPLVLSFMWPGLIIGIGAFVGSFFLMPAFFAAMPIPTPDPALRQAVLSAMQTGILVFIFIAGVLIPGLHVWIFQPRAMKETLEAFDTVERFTDKCPAPVFGITVSLLSIGIMQLLSIGVGIVAFFGLVLTGTAAAALLVTELVACLAIAHFVYRSRIEGWWGSLVFLLYLSLRNAVTFLAVDFVEILKQSGMLDKQTEEVMQIAFSKVPIGTLSAAFWALAGLSAAAYLVYAKKYFR